jgi:hypothetical protein
MPFWRSLHQHNLTELGRALQNLDTLRRGRTGRERLERLAEELTARYPDGGTDRSALELATPDATNAESAMTGSFGAGRTGSPDERATGIER